MQRGQRVRFSGAEAAFVVEVCNDSPASWTPGGPSSDTIADAWARRATLVDLRCASTAST